MRIFLIFLSAILLLGCHDTKKDYPIPSKRDIDEIVKVIMTQSKIYRNTLPLSIDLYRKGGPLKDFFAFQVENILDAKNPFHFQKSDSAYFVFQIHNLQHFKIDTTGILKTRFTSATKILSKNSNERRHYFNNALMIPVFSLDQKQAYVLMDSYYNIMASEGYGFMLRKINGKWQIVHEDLDWQS
jgi:hypothetical protein